MCVTILTIVYALGAVLVFVAGLLIEGEGGQGEEGRCGPKPLGRALGAVLWPLSLPVAIVLGLRAGARQRHDGRPAGETDAAHRS